MNASSRKITTTIFILIVVMVLSVIVSNFYKFFVIKDYDFVIEVPCDPTQSLCFFRYCDGDDCPPNNLEVYRIFSLNAADYEVCKDGTCLTECSIGKISCTETMCNEANSDSCVYSPPTLMLDEDPRLESEEDSEEEIGY
jgi:hypothetical protein